MKKFLMSWVAMIVVIGLFRGAEQFQEHHNTQGILIFLLVGFNMLVIFGLSKIKNF